jgi:hypothetical protein
MDATRWNVELDFDLHPVANLRDLPQPPQATEGLPESGYDDGLKGLFQIRIC